MTALPWLDSNSLTFPPTEQALRQPDGLLAAGGDLSSDRLLLAYRSGIFPWYEQGQPILWWSPDPRAVLFPEQLHVSRSMRKLLRRQYFRVSIDQDFDTVISHCANTPRAGQFGTWITEEMQQAYRHLYQLGYAHSVECWLEDKLVGGLYGISLGAAFFGESMFSHVDNASKACLITLSDHLQGLGFTMIDCQVHSPHLQSLGVSTLSRQSFLQHLAQALSQQPEINWPQQQLFYQGHHR